MTSQPFDATSDAVARIEGAWADIVTRHPDVEAEVVFVVKSDKRAWGHMTLGRTWQEDLPEGCEGPRRRWREIMLSAELLAQHPVRILQTMIHEAAHTVAQTRGVKDTSRQNRYHNGTFRAIAEEMGLEWAHIEAETVTLKGHGRERFLVVDAETGEAYDEDGDPLFPVEARPDATIGYSDMHISRETAEAYADTLHNLDGIKVKHHADRTAARPPRKRRTVCLVPTEGGWFEATEVGDRSEAEDVLGVTLTDEDIQRIGVVVYEGLAERKLLAGHVFWIEVA